MGSPLQNINILRKLDESNVPVLPLLRNCADEIKAACDKISVNADLTGRKMRETLRTRAFDEWASMPLRGAGIRLYQENTKTNSWVYNKGILSSSEWTTALKMSANVAAVRSVPGRNTGVTLCRHIGCQETETLPHVLGFCSKTELLRNVRHHKIRSTIASRMREHGWTVDEEVVCKSACGSIRRCDIIAFKPDKNQVLILDPTVHFETGLEQPVEVDAEKKAYYEPCKADLARIYNIAEENFQVTGLLFGARGSVPKFTSDFLSNLGVENKLIQEIALQVLKDSVRMLNIHLFR